MRRLKTSLIVGLMGAMCGTAASGQAVGYMSAEGNLNAAIAAKAPAGKAFKLQTPERMELKVASQAVKADAAKVQARRGVKAKATTSEGVAGYYVGTYLTLSSGSFDGGSTMQITRDAEGDSVTIAAFWNGCPARAKYDATTGTLSIPRQFMMTDANLGALDLAVASQTGAPDYSAQLVGTVKADGTIDFGDAWYGIYVQTKGTNKDKFVGAYYSLQMRKPNGTMTYVTSKGEQAGYYVNIDQTAPNMLAVSNIFNRGLSIEVELKRDRTASISNQVAMKNSYGSWVMIACKAFNDAGNLTQYSGTILTDAAAADNNTVLRWTDWSLLCQEASSYAGKLTNAVLTAAQPFSYPELTVKEFEGEGTEANPYLIKSLDHLILLADKVNTDEDLAFGSGTQAHTSTYRGKYFAMANDIDMQGYRFEPIGFSYSQRFGGVFDGKGHSIKGLSVDAGAKYYAGLFGMCDTTSVIKNVVLESPKVLCGYYSAGSLVGYTRGSLENITVNNPAMSGATSGNGGVAGIVGGYLKNCHVNGGVVMGVGFLGGVAGEVHGGAYNCSAVGTNVYLTGTGTPGGGVLGNLLEADGDQLWFSGLLSYANLSSDGGQYLGGVCGMIQNVKLSNSFFSGVMRGYSNESLFGGVTALLSSGTLENCYSSGYMQCYTRKGGGIVGQIQNGSSKKTPAVKNCYTSATVVIDTYQYDRNNCNEVIGTIIADSNPEISNVYYDRQVTDFKSTRFGSTTAALTAAQGPAGFPADAWTFTPGAYPRIKALAENEESKYSASAVNFATGDSYKKLSNNTALTALGNTKFLFANGQKLSANGHYAKIVDNKTMEIGSEFGSDTLYVVNGDVQTFHIVSIAPIPFEGDGSEEAPFLIKTKADMIALGEATTAKGQMFPGMYFALTNDIDMELDPAFDGICADNRVSAASTKFQGILDGRGHTIDRIYLKRFGWKTEPTATAVGTIDTNLGRSYSGLVGRLGEDGVIRNLNIGKNSKFEFYGTSGAFVGQQDGLVENCRNYADVLGYSCWIGGITGMVNKGGKIVNCYNDGNITTGYANAGGIAGTSKGLIDGCANAGDITAKLLCTNYAKQLQRVGGIVGGGSGKAVVNSVNYGTVYAQLNNAGGIAAAMEGTSSAGSFPKDSIANVVNVGNVYCGNRATLGAVLGLGGVKNVKNVYFDAQAIGLKAAANNDVEGMYASETPALTDGKALEGLSADLWDFKAGMYPALKAFADEPKVDAARRVLLTVKSGETVAELYTDVTLSDAATWTVAEGTAFRVEGGKLIVPQNVTAVTADTLVAVNKAGVRRPILVQAVPAMPLAGRGTEAEPYVINNTDEWTSLANWISATAKDLKGEFVAVTADLDFTGKTVTRMGADGITGFAATLNGRGHTVKGLDLKATANMKSGLFGTIQAAGAVTDLTFEGKVSAAYTFACPVVDNLYGRLENIKSAMTVTTTKANAAGVAGKAYAGASFRNVEFAGTLESNQTDLGGLVAQSEGGVSFADCKFTGTIKSTVVPTKATVINIGGLAANAGAATFTDCLSQGTISMAETTFTTTVAGFVGTAVGAKDNGLYTFTNCENATAITAGGKVAGFIAAAPSSSSSAGNAQYVLTDCRNTADITTESTKAISSAPTAGLVAIYTPGSRFTRCSNTGTVISNMNTYTAGIAAYYVGTPGSTSTPATVEFTDCENSGLIVADGNWGAGICAYVMGATTLTNCHNTGDIEGNRMLGGICAGLSGTGPRLYNCYNTGAISAKADRAGGLIAWGSPTNGTVEGCWNSGMVQSLSEVQDTKTSLSPAYEVAGLAAASSAAFKDCYNVGTVKGLSVVGGLVGTPTKGKTSFTNCYNAGRIIAPADSCGSIVGVSITAGKLWNADNVIENTYYLDENKSDHDADYAGRPVSRTQLAALDLGEGFTSPDEYTHPLVKAFADHPVALFHAAELVLAEGDTQQAVTKAFGLGGTPAVTWTTDCPALAVKGNRAEFIDAFKGVINVTATSGDLTKTYQLQADAQAGVSDILGDADVVSSRWYDAAGVEVAAPAQADGRVYIVVATMADGTTRTAKVVNK